MNELQTTETRITAKKPLREMELDELLSYLSKRHLKFVGTRLGCNSDAEAAEMMGISPQTTYNWANQETLCGYNLKEVVNEVVDRYRTEYVAVARSRLLKLTNDAVDVLENAVQGRIRNTIQYQAACKILDRTAPEPKKVQHTGADGESLPLVQNAIIINTAREMLEIEVDGRQHVVDVTAEDV